LRSHGLRGRTITLKYRDEDFLTSTRAETLDRPTDAGDVIFAAAWRLLSKVHGSKRVRLLGISVSSLGERPQLPLFGEAASRADALRDAVRDRFGAGALVRASVIATGAPDRPKRK
jgi:DNA polymerase-4